MTWLKQNWWLIVFIFSAGMAYAFQQVQIASINDKMDRSEYWRLRKEDSLKSVIEKLKLDNLQRKLKLPLGDSSKGGGN